MSFKVNKHSGGFACTCWESLVVKFGTTTNAKRNQSWIILSQRIGRLTYCCFLWQIYQPQTFAEMNKPFWEPLVRLIIKRNETQESPEMRVVLSRSSKQADTNQARERRRYTSYGTRTHALQVH